MHEHEDPILQLYRGPLKDYLGFLKSLSCCMLTTWLILRQLIFQQDGNVALCLILITVYERLACISTYLSAIPGYCLYQPAPVLGPPTRATQRLPMID